jgi:hypothetical protein
MKFLMGRKEQDEEKERLLKLARVQAEKELFGYVKRSADDGAGIEERLQGILMRIKKFKDVSEELEKFRESLVAKAGRQDA